MNSVAELNNNINRDIPKITGDRNYRRKHLICINRLFYDSVLDFYIVYAAY